MSVLVLRALVAGAGLLGVPPDQIAQKAAIPSGILAPEVIGDPDARVPASVLLRLWEWLPQVSGDESFGLWLAEQISLPLTAAWWLVLSSPTFGEGLARAVRYQRLLHDAARGEIVVGAGEVSYRHQIGAPPFRPPRHAIEFGFASLVLLARRATGQHILPRRLSLQHAAPRDLSRHRAVFGEGIGFDADLDEIVFDRKDLNLALTTSDSSLREVVEAHARALVERLPKSPTTAARVSETMCELFAAGAPEVEHVARRLGIPKRTLQRRLRDEGVSFSALLDRVRRELAERYLGDRRLSVQETAFLLGFSDVSAFHRAFLRWTGETPARFRAKRQ